MSVRQEKFSFGRCISGLLSLSLLAMLVLYQPDDPTGEPVRMAEKTAICEKSISPFRSIKCETRGGGALNGGSLKIMGD